MTVRHREPEQQTKEKLRSLTWDAKQHLSQCACLFGLIINNETQHSSRVDRHFTIHFLLHWQAVQRHRILFIIAHRLYTQQTIGFKHLAHHTLPRAVQASGHPVRRCQVSTVTQKDGLFSFRCLNKLCTMLSLPTRSASHIFTDLSRLRYVKPSEVLYWILAFIYTLSWSCTRGMVIHSSYL